MRTAVYYTVTMTLVAAITSIAVLWCHLNHIRVGQGRMLFHLWGTHGVHVFDIQVLVAELIIVVLLTATLIRGFAHPR